MKGRLLRTYTINFVTSGKGRKTTEVVVIVGTANSIFLERNYPLGRFRGRSSAFARLALRMAGWPESPNHSLNRAVPDGVNERLVYPRPAEPCSCLPGGLAANSHFGGSARPNPSPAAVRACLESYPQRGRRQNIVGEPGS
jgi:hypothetical protein